MIGQVFTSKHHDSTPSSGFMIFNAGIHGGYSCSQMNGHNITYITVIRLWSLLLFCLSCMGHVNTNVKSVICSKKEKVGEGVCEEMLLSSYRTEGTLEHHMWTCIIFHWALKTHTRMVKQSQ